MKVRIHGGRVIDPANGVDTITDLYITDGRIAAIGRAPEGFEADIAIDAEQRIVMPGIVDLRARLREPGEEHKGNITSETTAAASGGVTSLCCPPDTNPVIDTSAVINLIRQRAAEVGKSRVYPIGAVTPGLAGEQLSEMVALKQAGCVVFSNARRPIHNTMVLRRAMEYAATHNLTLFLHPEDPGLPATAVPMKVR